MRRFGTRRVLVSRPRFNAIEWLAGLPGTPIIWTMQDQPPSTVLTSYPNTVYNGVNNGITMGLATGLPGGLNYAGTFNGTSSYGANYSAALATAWPDPNVTPISMI